MKKLTILNYDYTIPLYGNKHLNAYGKAEIISPRGKRRVIYYEIGKIKNNILVENVGSLYSPQLVAYYLRG